MSSRLPDEIIEENILFRLPVKSISRFRCVSKTWRILFQNPNFIKNHLNHAIQMNKFNILVKNCGDRDAIRAQPDLLSINYNNVLSSSPVLGRALKIDNPFMSRESVPATLGSCNGLVCVGDFYAGICIWNPATREYKQVPKHTAGSNGLFIAYGFGFDGKNNDYKLLGIDRFHSSEVGGDVFEARLYSLASNSWKNLGVIPYDLGATLDANRQGLFHDGVLYWISYTGVESWVFVCFDIFDETFYELPSPNNISKEDGDHSRLDLGIWEGKLCLLFTKHTEDADTCQHQNDHMDMWTMMDNKWSKHLKIITENMTDMYYGRYIQTLQNGEILFEGGEGNGLLSYDPNTERTRALNINGVPDEYEVETYIETLVALNSGTYVKQLQID